MSLLWTQAVQHQAMPWHHDDRSAFTHPVVHPVKKAGFASYTDDRDYLHDLREGHDHDDDEDDGFDDDLYDSVRPEPTPEEEAHQEEHGEYPAEYHDRHSDAYDAALDERNRRKAEEDEPDFDDPDLMKFIRNHGSNTKLWRKYGELKDVDLTGRVHATQSHVSQTHIDRYHQNPGDISDHVYTYGDVGGREYLGEEAPMFVTHGGELHVTEGHHRTAAALARGDKSIKGWHYNLDEDRAKTKAQEEVNGDETWTDPEHWDEDDHEHYGSG